jgi:DNA polymerase (family 10)
VTFSGSPVFDFSDTVPDEGLFQMPILNADIAEIFTRMANLLEIEDANPFRVRAYRNASRVVAGLGREIADMHGSGEDLTDLPGIGKDLAAKIDEIIRTGTLKQLETLEGQTPPGLNDLMNIPGLGPRKVAALYRHLNITTSGELRAAAEEKKIRELDGFGEKSEQSILESLAGPEVGKDRILFQEAEQRAGPLVDYLKKGGGIENITVAGSFRRCRETVGDLDILVACADDGNVMDRFTGYEDVRKIVSKGSTRSTVVLLSGLQVDLRVVPLKSYGAALHYFTGSKAHNIAVRKRGVKRGLKINEYGVFKKEKQVAGRTEEEVYQAVGLGYIEPELREDRGEIEAAENGRLPALVRLEDIRGDLHAHTDATDGRSSLREMAEAARKRGYEYLAITEHSKRVTMAGGLDAGKLAAQIEQIDRLNEQFEGFRLLKGIEVDILADGSLDLPDGILERLDLCVCSVHYNQNLSREKQTDRILRAMENPFFNILAHPTGRLIGRRKPYDVDLEKIMEAAQASGIFLELNAEPERMDLSDTRCMTAREIGVKVAISTDAHSAASLDFMRYGIGQARRGWLEPDNVINTRPLSELLKLIGKRK